MDLKLSYIFIIVTIIEIEIAVTIMPEYPAPQMIIIGAKAVLGKLFNITR